MLLTTTSQLQQQPLRRQQPPAKLAGARFVALATPMNGRSLVAPGSQGLKKASECVEITLACLLVAWHLLAARSRPAGCCSYLLTNVGKPPKNTTWLGRTTSPRRWRGHSQPTKRRLLEQKSSKQAPPPRCTCKWLVGGRSVRSRSTLRRLLW